MADAVDKSVSPERDKLQDDPPPAETVESLQAKLAETEAKLAEKDRLLQQDQATVVDKQVKAVKLPDSDPSLKDMSFNQLCRVFPRPVQFSSCSQNVLILDWLDSMADWINNVHLPHDSWERIVAGSLLEIDLRLIRTISGTSSWRMHSSLGRCFVHI